MKNMVVLILPPPLQISVALERKGVERKGLQGVSPREEARKVAHLKVILRKVTPQKEVPQRVILQDGLHQKVVLQNHLKKALLRGQAFGLIKVALPALPTLPKSGLAVRAVLLDPLKDGLVVKGLLKPLSHLPAIEVKTFLGWMLALKGLPRLAEDRKVLALKTRVLREPK